MGLFGKKRDRDPAVDYSDWIYVLGPSRYQTQIGRRERDVRVVLRAFKSKDEVSVYLDGKVVGELNAKRAAQFAPMIRENAPDTLRVQWEGRVLAVDGRRLYAVHLRPLVD